MEKVNKWVGYFMDLKENKVNEMSERIFLMFFEIS